MVFLKAIKSYGGFWYPFNEGDSHEEPWIDVSEDYSNDIERHLRESLSGVAKTSRRSSKGRVPLRACLDRMPIRPNVSAFGAADLTGEPGLDVA